jgi:hypothetical protein
MPTRPHDSSASLFQYRLPAPVVERVLMMQQPIIGGPATLNDVMSTNPEALSDELFDYGIGGGLLGVGVGGSIPTTDTLFIHPPPLEQALSCINTSYFPSSGSFEWDITLRADV